MLHHWDNVSKVINRTFCMAFYFSKYAVLHIIVRILYNMLSH